MKHYNRLIVTLIFAVISLALYVTSGICAVDKAYGSSSMMFKVQLPSGWVFKSDVNGEATFNGPDKAFLWVYRKQAKEVPASEMVSFYTTKGYKLLYARKETKLSNLKAGRFILLKSDAGVQWRYDVTDLYVGGIQWVLFAVAPRDNYKKVENAFKTIYSTFKIPSAATATSTSTKPVTNTTAAKPASDSKVDAPAAKTAEYAALTTKVETKTGVNTTTETSGVPTGDVLKAAPKDSPVEQPKESPKETPKETPKEAPKETAKENPRESVSAKEQDKTVQPQPQAQVEPSTPGIGRPPQLSYVRYKEVWVRDLVSLKDKGVGQGSAPSLSRDSSTLVYKSSNDKWTVMRLDTGTKTEVKIDSKVEHVSVSPDGSYIAYSVTKKPLLGQAYSKSYLMKSDGKERKELWGFALSVLRLGVTTKLPEEDIEWWADPQFTQDSNRLVMTVKVNGDLAIADVDLTKSSANLIVDKGEMPIVSPTGDRLLYRKKVAGSEELWMTYTDGRLHERLGMLVTGPYAWFTAGEGVIMEKAGNLELHEKSDSKVSLYLQGGTLPSTSLGTMDSKVRADQPNI